MTSCRNKSNALSLADVRHRRWFTLPSSLLAMTCCKAMSQVRVVSDISAPAM